MRNIRQLFRYMLPVLVLPLPVSYTAVFRSASINRFGYQITAALSVFSSASSMIQSALYILAMVGIAVPALLSEAGKIKAAKNVHTVFFIVYASVLFTELMIFMFLPEIVLTAITTNEVLIELTADAMIMYAAIVFAVSLTGGLIAQLVKKYSMILVLCLCGGLQVAAVSFDLTGMILDAGLWTSAISTAVEFAACRVLPFVMIPIASYYRSFRKTPSVPIPERAAEETGI